MKNDRIVSVAMGSFSTAALLALASCGGSTTAAKPAVAQPAAAPFDGEALALALAAACPPAAPDDAAARASCADKLTALPVLRDQMDEPFLWGGQKTAGDYNLEHSHLTKFAPLVWRRMYLSTFMFDGDHKVEQVGDQTIVHLGVSFRSELDAGEYPYPFWHSEKKWRAYQVASELIFVVENGKIKGAFRGGEPIAERDKNKRQWDGQWMWHGGEEPRVTLFKNLFSAENPYVAALETNYRELESAMRQYNCASCHAPNNPAGMNPLELLTYPNQALAARRAIIEQIEKNTMPPETAENSAGIADPVARERILTLARAFAAEADRALAHEGEPAR